MFTQLIWSAICNMIYLALHITNTGSFPKPLSAAQERECLILVKKGDLNARNKLIEHNLRLVAHIIKKYYSTKKDQEDLISIGTIGLIKAVSTFNIEKGTRFATYAARCIENEILMHFRGQKKISLEMSMSDAIDTDNDGNSLTLMDIVCDDDNIINIIDLKTKSEKLYDYISKRLDNRERMIIVMRYGLYGRKPLTQREIASKLKISRSYVSRIEKKAVLTLKKFFVNDRQNVDIGGG